MVSRSIALIGLSGTGKSTVGRELAARTGLPLLDTDALIVAGEGQAITDIFAAHGETYFRQLESRALTTALKNRSVVVATGGGIVLQTANRELLRETSFVVWLDAPTDSLVARLLAHDEQRPLLQGHDLTSRIEALRSARASLYAETAHVRIDTQKRTAEAIATEILNHPLFQA